MDRNWRTLAFLLWLVLFIFHRPVEAKEENKVQRQNGLSSAHTHKWFAIEILRFYDHNNSQWSRAFVSLIYLFFALVDFIALSSSERQKYTFVSEMTAKKQLITFRSAAATADKPKTIDDWLRNSSVCRFVSSVGFFVLFWKITLFQPTALHGKIRINKSNKSNSFLSFVYCKIILRQFERRSAPFFGVFEGAPIGVETIQTHIAGPNRFILSIEVTPSQKKINRSCLKAN